MSNQLSEQMELARVALENGEVPRARRMLRRIVHQESDNYRAWLWLAGVTDAPKAAIQYIKRAQALEPSSPSVSKALEWANKRLAEGDSAADRLIATHKDGFMPLTNATQIALPQDIQAHTSDNGLQAPVPMPTVKETQPEVTNPDTVPAGFNKMVKRVGLVLVAIALIIVVAILLIQRLGSGGATSDTSAIEPLPIVLVDNKMDAQPVTKTQSQVAASSEVHVEVSDEASVEEPLVLIMPEDEVESAEIADSSASVVAVSIDTTVADEQTDQRLNDASLAESVAVDQSFVSEEAAVVIAVTPVPRGFLPKKAVAQAEPLAQWTPTPEPTAEPTAEPVAPRLEALLFDEPRWIDVNLTTQYLTAYENGVAVFSTYISSGLPETPTVVGQFRIYLRLESQDMNGYQIGYDYYTPDVPYVMYFHGNYAIHGAYWHNNFGYPMSHGCVNTSVADGAWLFNFAGVGTLVNVHY